MTSDQDAVAEHVAVYRLTASGKGGEPETRYFLSPYETDAWKGRLEEMGYRTEAAVAPASAFLPVGAEELGALAAAEREQARG